MQAAAGTALSSSRVARERTRLGLTRAVMIAVAVLGFALDRITKSWALAHLQENTPSATFAGGWVSLELLFNSGAAFSMGSSATIVFSVLALMALAFMLVWVWPRARGWLASVCAGVLVAGIGGNLADRLLRPPGVLRGHVVDFIAVQHFAVFNVADMFISTAAVLFVIYVLVSGRDEEPSDAPASPQGSVAGGQP
ncbi:signal peptidase II [Propionibacterium cyclohexanicum]|uniref:Lipoprotein signal peptidase n=1 Tax=Propionibacterium cyclohexanicum TaxID=64702 RepID=A0A1H9PJZ8_9ACTN|nr:signal peptidase II [Propionibacterium cyclohexanicum]SER48494.1 signal peptidase II [Propionibacterium cyclohexanicum]